MNAVIALCHFCELHGPSILFCTKPFHCVNHTQLEIENRSVEATPSSCGISNIRLQSNKDEKQPQFTGSQSTCEACRSLEPGEPGFISFNKESHISYISTQHPEEQELYSVLRHACVRSLSCEICPGREGPIMFGDDASGYVFSYTFFLKDMQSRGFQRWYSIICVMMDRNYLVNSWPFLISNFKTVIDELQSKADIFYKNEQAEKPQLESQLLPRNTVLTPDAYRRSRGGQIYRSLRHIVNEKNVFEKLHKAFSWIIQASCERYTEKLLEGTCMNDYMNEEEMTSIAVEDILKSHQDYSHPIFTSILHAYHVLGIENFHLLAFHVVRGDQVVVQSDFKRTAVSLLKVLKELIPAGCFRCQAYEEKYQDSWRCNFLGLKECCDVPQHLLQSSQLVLVTITKETREEENLSASHFRVCENSFNGFQIHVVGTPVEKEPSYLKSVMESLNNEHMSEELFAIMLLALKERWMGRVKVLFKFSKDSIKSTDEKNKLLGLLHAKPDDEILLKYWMTSLSKSYRLQLLSGSFSSVT